MERVNEKGEVLHIVCASSVLQYPFLLRRTLFFSEKNPGHSSFLIFDLMWNSLVSEKGGEWRRPKASDFSTLVASLPWARFLVRGDLRVLRARSLFCFARETRE